MNAFVPLAFSHSWIAWYRSMTASVKSASVTSHSPRSDRTKLAPRDDCRKLIPRGDVIEKRVFMSDPRIDAGHDGAACGGTEV